MASDRTLEKLAIKNRAFRLQKPEKDLIHALPLERKDKIVTSAAGGRRLFVTCRPHHKHSFFTIGCGWLPLASPPSEIALVSPDSQHSELAASSGYLRDIGDVAPFLHISLPNHEKGQFRWMPHIDLAKQNLILPPSETLSLELTIEETWPDCPADLLLNLDSVSGFAADFANRICTSYFGLLD